MVAVRMPQAVGHQDRRRGGDQAAARDGAERRPPLARCALDQQRDQHPAGEVGQERDRRVGGDGAPAGEIVDVVPRQAGDRQRAEEQRLAARAAPQPQRGQPDQRKQQVEDHLDGQRPRRGIQLQQRVRRVVLREQEEHRQLACVHQPAPRHVARRGQQDERPGQREVVRGRDPRRAPHEIAADGDRPAAAQRRARERAVQQVARQHEEHHERHPALEQQRLLPRVAAQLDRVRQLVDPHVDREHDQRGDPAQAVERCVSALCRFGHAVPEVGGGEAVERSNHPMCGTPES